MTSCSSVLRAGLLLGALAVIAFVTSARTAGADPGVSNDRILVGQAAALRGADAHLGLGMNAGLEACFAQVNERGGVHGRRIELKTINDGFDPVMSVKATNTLLDKMRVLALIGGVGTETSQAALMVAEQRKAPFIAPLSGAEVLRTPYKRYAVNLRGSHHMEMERLVQHMVEEQGYDRIACFYASDDVGRNGFAGVERALIKRGMTAAGGFAYSERDPNTDTAIDAIAELRPEAIVLVGDAKRCASFVKAAKKDDRLAGAIFCSTSQVGVKELKSALGAAGDGCIVSQVVPFPWDTNLPIVAEFHKAMKSIGREREIGFVSLEGYMAGRLFCQALENVRGEPTREKLINAFSKVGVFDLGGVEAVFGPQDHQGMDLIFLTKIDGRRLAPVDSGAVALVED